MKFGMFVLLLSLSSTALANQCTVEICDSLSRCTIASVDKSAAYVGKRMGSYHEGGKSITRRITRVISCRGIG